MGVITSAEAIEWIERLCRVPKGPAVGQPVRLLEFQREILRGIFDNPAGTRTAIISYGRQNGKTTLAAYLLLLFLCGKCAQRNGLLVSTALTRDQAAILFDAAAKCVRLSPELAAAVQIQEYHKVLKCPDLGTTYRALSADAPTQLGLSPYFMVHDELGAVRGPFSSLYDTVESGSGVQVNPLSIIISTQARSDTDLLSVLIDDAASGTDPKVKLFLWTAPKELDPFSDAAIRAANPAFDHFQNQAEQRDKAKKAKRLPSSEGAFRNLILNQRVDAVSPFISRAVWEENGAEPTELEGEVYGGLDLASVNDLCALVLLKPDGSVHPFCWLPEEGLEEKSRHDKVDYVTLAKQGHLLTTPGAAVSYDYVAAFLRDLFNRCDVRSIAFDRALMRFLKPCLVRAGFTEDELTRFIEVGQGFFGMGPNVRELESWLLQRLLRHGNHPVLTMCAANVVVVTDDANNRKFTKRRSSGRIDALVALAMACGAMPLAPAVPQYAEGRLLIA